MIRSLNNWSMCDDDSLCVETVLNLFKISDFMSCLNIGISIQVIITKFYVKYYLLVLHTSLCVITNSLLNTWTIHLINDFVYQKNIACVKWLKVKRLNDFINMKLPHALCSNMTKSFYATIILALSSHNLIYFAFKEIDIASRFKLK